MNISIAGTGKMGSAIAARLLGLGHQVTVWNRTPARAQPLLALGARSVTQLEKGDIDGALPSLRT